MLGSFLSIRLSLVITMDLWSSSSSNNPDRLVYSMTQFVFVPSNDSHLAYLNTCVHAWTNAKVYIHECWPFLTIAAILVWKQTVRSLCVLFLMLLTNTCSSSSSTLWMGRWCKSIYIYIYNFKPYSASKVVQNHSDTLVWTLTMTSFIQVLKIYCSCAAKLILMVLWNFSNVQAMESGKMIKWKCNHVQYTKTQLPSFPCWQVIVH